MGLGQHALPLRLLKLLNIALMTLPFGAVWMLFYLFLLILLHHIIYLVLQELVIHY